VLDLMSLITVCAIGIDPSIMHALVWHESAGDPWSFSVRGDVDRRTYRTLEDAVAAAKTMPPGIIRVGLAGLPVESLTLSTEIFMPCANLAAATRELGRDIQRCGSGPSVLKPDVIWCAIAAYRGSWEHPDEQFASAVRVSASANRTPNFAIPDDALTPAAAIGARLEISTRWQEPTTTVKQTPHLGSSPPPSVDQPTARTIIVELDRSGPEMFIEPRINVPEQLFVTSKR
jgi:Transglycosylase SLT domain